MSDPRPPAPRAGSSAPSPADPASALGESELGEPEAVGSESAATPWLNPTEERAWRGYLRMRTLLDLQVNRDLGRDSGLSGADYQVLATLSEAEGHRLRLIELAARMRWSKSRLSHHLDRMAIRDLVAREEHPSNSRAALVVLTGHGHRTIETAAPHHLRSVRRHFLDLLTDEQLATLGDLTDAVLEHLGGLPVPGPAAQRPPD